MTGGLRPRDYVETADGLIFAIVSPLCDAGRFLASLRYVKEEGSLRKVDTAAAAALLGERHPDWIVHSPLVDASVHLVPPAAVVRTHRVGDALEAGRPSAVRTRARLLLELLRQDGVPVDRLGVSGSLLLGGERGDSDIDLVAQEREAFQRARQGMRCLIARGLLTSPSTADWEDAWRRRGSPRTLAEYAWHESRKGTKALIDGTRIDLSLVLDPRDQLPLPSGARKLERATITATVTDAAAAFEHPARFRVSHGAVAEVLAFTPTYAGQAETGEVIEASGWIEEDASGVRRLVVGTSREAPGEWIRVVR